MTTNTHDFEELAAPKAAAEELGISVATLRKYSLIVEKVTGKSNYWISFSSYVDAKSNLIYECIYT